MKVAEVIALFQDIAPIQYQESYDNSGLQVGNSNDEVRAALLSLDVTEAVIDEAIGQSCNLIITHHPLLFSGLKSLTGHNYVQRIIQKAIKYDINILSVHTNLDNVQDGVNQRIAQKLNLKHTQILAPTSGNLFKLQAYVPVEHVAKVKQALFAVGAGKIGRYDECSFTVHGEGSFKPSIEAQPFIGVAGGEQEQVREAKLEMIVQAHLKSVVERALLKTHPYEEVAFDWVSLANKNTEIGAGMIGVLEEPMNELAFLTMLKANMKASSVRYTQLLGKQISKVAICGGSGSFLLQQAIAVQADVFVSADFKYHQFFDADGKIIIADIGHYETEQFTVDLFDDLLKKKNVTFAVILSSTDTNPIKYL